jgi:hypothetical protein
MTRLSGLRRSIGAPDGPGHGRASAAGKRRRKNALEQSLDKVRARPAREETTVFHGLAAQRLLLLFVAGWLVLNFPLLGMWVGAGTLWGLPRLPAALFLLWAALIVAVALVVERSDDSQPPP